MQRLREARRLRRRMRAALGYEPNFNRPRTFNEKVAWRILHDRNPLIALTTDKLAVRRYVAAKASPDILVPLLGTWDRAEAIDWAALPPRFVLKASHGWNMNLLVHDKAAVDRDAALATAAGWLRHNHAAATGEWGYRDIQPRLLAETMLLDEAGEIPADLKFYVFNGRMRLLRVHTGRFGDHRITFFDRAMHPLPVNQIHPADPDWSPPPGITEAMRLAERLGADFDFARVDLYLALGRFWFGEITHYDGNATVAYEPCSYDRIIGDMWQLPGSAAREA
ncbi:ATP-grasp fold amidoligase family protein [Dankookia sp. GCM10030260]